jgi:hypothetical protein
VVEEPRRKKIGSFFYSQKFAALRMAQWRLAAGEAAEGGGGRARDGKESVRDPSSDDIREMPKSLRSQFWVRDIASLAHMTDEQAARIVENEVGKCLPAPCCCFPTS